MTEVIDELVENALRELADEAYQRRLWLASGGSEVSSFTECVSRLWDDSGLSEALDQPHSVYTPEIDDHLRELRAFLGRIDDSRSPEAILKDPRLESVRAMAYALLQDLRRFGSDYSS
ncbi:MAG: hypothetical protein ACRDGU_02315 [Actinomycetota bacterium]